MLFRVISIFLCAFSMIVFAQESPKNLPDSANTVLKTSFSTIEGEVVDSSASEPVPFASVALYILETNKLAGGTVADVKGKFIIGRVQPGNYRLAISYVGYLTQNINSITIKDGTEKLDVKSIKLRTTAKKLNDVVITGQRSLIEEKVDRTVYNAEFDATNRGGDATDVLRKAPMLSVDMDGNVSMRGSQNVKILINNKPTTMAANSIADALKMIPADLIQSVEVITSPSAKYDAEGSAGIINIVLKENKLQGFSLGVDGSVGIRGSNLGLNGSYRKNKMAFSLGGMGRFRYNTPGNFINDQTTIGTNGTETQTKQSATTQNQMGGGNYSLGWEYEINKSNSINASLKYGFRNNVVDQNHLLTENYVNGTLLNNSMRNVNSTNLSGTWDASVGYTHAFAKKQEELSILALYSRNDLTNNFFNTIIGVGNPDSVISRLKNINTGYNQESTIQVDYQTPISTNQLLEVGAKNILRNVSSDYKYYTALGANGEFVTSQGANLSNVFSYDQNITAAYASYTISLPKGYSAKGGVRYEYTSIQSHLQDNKDLSIPAYGVLVPSVNFSKKLDNGSVLKASYNRRIQRPSFQYINPNAQSSNPLNVTVGNPNLNPEYTNNYELAYSTNVKQVNVSLAAFARMTDNSIQSIREVRGSDTIKTTYQNIGTQDAYGMNLHMNVDINNKLTFSGGGDVYYAILKNNVSNPLYNASNQGWVASFRLMGSYTLDNGWGIQAFGFYRGQQVQLQGYQGGFGVYSLSIKKDFNDKKGSIGIGAENFFSPSTYIPSELNSPTIHQTSMNVMHNMNFKINFSYRIGKMSLDEPRKKGKKEKSINNDDLKEENNDSPIQNSGGMK